MGRVAKLVEVINQLPQLNRNDTIYASKPWSPHSDAIVATEPVQGGIPTEAKNLGLKYFLEVSISIDFVEDWKLSLNKTPSTREVCDRLIRYATNDA